jgi:hypothetical protein
MKEPIQVKMKLQQEELHITLTLKNLIENGLTFNNFSNVKKSSFIMQ